ncbi:hypothetical protein FHS83_000115 [Rhizomicrobium palustre]|uniref:Uncharacterized protein n=1 Tax=Rhizomicrobium palustre TaxID=189966 RepID=A0A846MUW0_9PROT|nr:hypothetical protein [Rhizomicrobium palustre]NIK86797.1 hypothetical protein [Rhizomicrobium palustre]
MTEITLAAKIPGSRTEFATFLYADIGTEKNGSVLTVLSAMARMNLDPWREAATLAELPAKKAVKRLTDLIASLPENASPAAEQEATAERLVKLLPRQGLLDTLPASQGHTNIPPYLQGVAEMWSSKAPVYILILLIALTLAAGWFVADTPASIQVRPTASETAAKPTLPAATSKDQKQ